MTLCDNGAADAVRQTLAEECFRLNNCLAEKNAQVEFSQQVIIKLHEINRVCIKIFMYSTHPPEKTNLELNC